MLLNYGGNFLKNIYSSSHHDKRKETCSVPPIDSEEKKLYITWKLDHDKMALRVGEKRVDKVKRENSKMTTFFLSQ